MFVDCRHPRGRPAEVEVGIQGWKDGIEGVAIEAAFADSCVFAQILGVWSTELDMNSNLGSRPGNLPHFIRQGMMPAIARAVQEPDGIG